MNAYKFLFALTVLAMFGVIFSLIRLWTNPNGLAAVALVVCALATVAGVDALDQMEDAS